MTTETSEILKPSTQWHAELYSRVTILDPDGWDRKRLHESMAEPISEGEFRRRLMLSTVSPLTALDADPSQPEPGHEDSTGCFQLHTTPSYADQIAARIRSRGVNPAAAEQSWRDALDDSTACNPAAVYERMKESMAEVVRITSETADNSSALEDFRRNVQRIAVPSANQIGSPEFTNAWAPGGEARSWFADQADKYRNQMLVQMQLETGKPTEPEPSHGSMPTHSFDHLINLAAYCRDHGFGATATKAALDRHLDLRIEQGE